jgi:hypothetical protein
MNAIKDLTTSTRPLPLTRGQEVVLHLIEGAPFAAHVIETPDDGRRAYRDTVGTLELYVDGHPLSLVDSLEEAIEIVRTEIRERSGH